jgi:3' terminal RNA ribose 2'-O-methyltransferase Hen1
MFLKITTTHKPATDLGWLLHKRPDKVQTFDIAGGQAHVFYPEATEERCSAVLVTDVDTVELVRTMNIPSDRGMLGQYVNDRPYTASSFMTTAISKVYTSALNGTCKERPELLEIVMPLEVTLAVMRVGGSDGEASLRRMFEPLCYTLDVKKHPLDPKFPSWGESWYYTVTLHNLLTVKELLEHLYILLGVFDNEKHYNISTEEIEKLMSRGGSWLTNHPQREFITRRYLRNIGNLSKMALKRFDAIDEENLVENDENSENTEGVAVVTKPIVEKINLHQLRLETACEALKKSGVKSVIDLGCGEGKLIKLLLKHTQFEKVLGMDVSMRELQRAKRNLNFDELAPRMRERVDLMQGSVTYRDKRFEGFEGAALVEVIEHLDLDRLAALERVVFEFPKFKTVVVTTPNSEYNVKYETLHEGTFRHTDHRFEWTRAEFENWANGVAEKYKYGVVLYPVGEVDEAVGAPSQMVVFTLM